MDQAIVQEMHSKINAAYQAMLAAKSAIEDAIAYGTAHGAVDSVPALTSALDSQQPHIDELRGILETYSEVQALHV